MRDLFVIFVLAVTMLTTPDAPSPRRAFPQHVAYEPSAIHPNDRLQSQQDDDVRAYYDEWKRRFLVDAGTSANGSALYRVSFGKSDPARTVSEGQGYGMMIVAWMAGHDPDAQRLFDGLWNFSRLHPSGNDDRLMNWEVPVIAGHRSSAFDGDCDIAYALLLADAQWGSSGAIDYRGEAKRVLAAIASSMIGPESHLPTLGDWVDFDGDIHNQYTVRSSDLIVDHFRTFAAVTGDPRWSEVARASQWVITSLQENYSPETGLLPDFIVAADEEPEPAHGRFLEGRYDGKFSYNAVRTPWRIGFDALVSNDPESIAQARRISRWAESATDGVPARVASGYALNGTPIRGGEEFSALFAAPLGVAAMTDAGQQKWLNDIYGAVREAHEGYYEDSVTLLSMLVMTGNAWPPEAAPSSTR